MYTVAYGFGEVTYDWITPVRDISSIYPLANEDLIICFIENPITKVIDIWKCNPEWDYEYDLQRFYSITYGDNFNWKNIKKVYTKIDRISTAKPI